MNILVIENTLFYSDAIQAAFFRRGHTCFLVNTVEDAVSHVSSLPFDLIVVDIVLQDSSAVEELLYSCYVRNITVILVSDYREVSFRYCGYSVGGVVPRDKLLVYSFMENLVSDLEAKNISSTGV